MKAQVASSAVETKFWTQVSAELLKANLTGEKKGSDGFTAAYTALGKAEAAYWTRLNATKSNTTAADKATLNKAAAAFHTQSSSSAVLLVKAMWTNAKDNATKTKLQGYLNVYKKADKTNKAAEKTAGNGGSGSGTKKGGSNKWIWIALGVVIVAALGLFAYTKGCPKET